MFSGLLRVLETRASFLKSEQFLFMCLELSIKVVVWFAKWKTTLLKQADILKLSALT